MEKYSDIRMRVSDNGGYIVCFQYTWKPVMSGYMDNCSCDYKEETFGPKEGPKAFARLEALKAMMIKGDED